MLLLRSIPLRYSGGAVILIATLVVSSVVAEIDEESEGILLPPDDKYNFVGKDDPPPGQKSQESSQWRKSRGELPQSIQISSNGFKIRDGSSQSPTITTKPLPITTSGRPSTLFVNNNCFGTRCPKPSTLDDSTSYHYVLNKDVPISSSSSKRKWRRPNPLKTHVDSPRVDRSTKRSLDTQVHLSLPFIVDPSLPKDTRAFPSFPSPGWVKLNPVLADQYDLFTLRNTTPRNPQSPQSSFSDRLGVELSPDSFADRWGWGSSSQGQRPSSENPPGGTRLPSWLQDIHNTRITNQNTRYPSRDSSDSKWEKLVPIPVAGVSISKWVPKGSPPEDLPSTNWPSRDPHRPHNNNNAVPWWEQVDKAHQQRPYAPVSSSYGPSSSSYGPASHQIPPSHHRNRPGDLTSSGGWGSGDKSPTNAWDEIIYPEGPTSATASWQKDKDFQQAPPTKYGGGWGNSLRRPPTNYPPASHSPQNYPTGSWSSSNHNSQQHPFINGGFDYSKIPAHISSASSDDPRWVLVSNSRKVTVDSRPPLPSSLQVGTYAPVSSNLRPGFDTYADFPFYERPSRGGETSNSPHRNGKDFKGRLQDEAFSRVNATLANLAPVLNLRGSNKLPADQNSKGSSSTGAYNSSTSSKAKLPAFIKPYATEDERRNFDSRNKTVAAQFLGGGGGGRKGLSINPVYAAVGAGMIPATMAAVLPMVLGRRRRRRSPDERSGLKTSLYSRSLIPDHRWWGE